MLVKNTKNQSTDLPDHLRDYAFGQNESGVLPLTPDKKYVVSGVRTVDGNRFYLVIPDTGELKGYPWWYPASLFEIVDESIPSDWVEGGVEGDSFHTFLELASDTSGQFESNLEDGDDEEIAVFLSYYEKYAKAYGMGYADLKTLTE